MTVEKLITTHFTTLVPSLFVLLKLSPQMFWTKANRIDIQGILYHIFLPDYSKTGWRGSVVLLTWNCRALSSCYHAICLLLLLLFTESDHQLHLIKVPPYTHLKKANLQCPIPIKIAFNSISVRDLHNSNTLWHFNIVFLLLIPVPLGFGMGGWSIVKLKFIPLHTMLQDSGSCICLSWVFNNVAKEINGGIMLLTDLCGSSHLAFLPFQGKWSLLFIRGESNTTSTAQTSKVTLLLGILSL